MVNVHFYFQPFYPSTSTLNCHCLCTLFMMCLGDLHAGFILFLALMMVVLGAKLKQLESEIETKTKEAKAAETNAEALRKESVGFLLEYDRFLEENQNLRNQLQSFDRRL